MLRLVKGWDLLIEWIIAIPNPVSPLKKGSSLYAISVLPSKPPMATAHLRNLTFLTNLRTSNALACLNIVCRDLSACGWIEIRQSQCYA